LISGHVTDYKPASVQPLDVVKAQVTQKLVAQQSAELARKAGEAKLAEVRASKSTAGFSPASKITRADTQGVPAQAIAPIFKADPQKLPAYVGVDLGDGGYAIYRVNSVNVPTTTDPQHLAGAQQQLAQLMGGSEWNAYQDALRDRSRVSVYGTPAASAE
jgi:peptidyl-prolyl cis-trans isomerase D